MFLSLYVDAMIQIMNILMSQMKIVLCPGPALLGLTKLIQADFAITATIPAKLVMQLTPITVLLFVNQLTLEH